MVVVVAYIHEYTKHHQIIYFHMVNCMVFELCLNTAALKKQPLGGVTEHPWCPVFRDPGTRMSGGAEHQMGLGDVAMLCESACTPSVYPTARVMSLEIQNAVAPGTPSKSSSYLPSNLCADGPPHGPPQQAGTGKQHWCHVG